MDEGIFVPITLFVVVAFAIYFFLKARTAERLAMIEKGMDISLLQKKGNTTYALLKTGVILIGISIGLLIGFLLETNTNIPEPVSYSSMILLFGGLSMIAGNLYSQKKKKVEQEF